MIGSAMEALVTWTIVGLELAALAAIAGGFVWSIAKSIIVYTRDGFVTLSAFSCGDCGRQQASCGGGCPGPSAE